VAQPQIEAILIQLTGHHGEKHGGRHDYPGYDPISQAITGTCTASARGLPDLPRLASCVDYLCGYLAAWAGWRAVRTRAARRRRGDHAQTSLTAAASLTQLLFQHGEPQFSASGPNAGGRLCALSDGWIFACDGGLTENRASDTVGAALARLKGMGIEAVRVNTVRELADHHEQHPSRTIRFVENSSEGWASKCFVPTWFCFDDAPPEARAVTPRIGSSADAILAEVGYGSADIARLRTSGVVMIRRARGERPDPAPSRPQVVTHWELGDGPRGQTGRTVTGSQERKA
jgi:crotonobetainyl-CoA:carnitine CoA-transferase CaiB-like acyl-CoA transferase